LPHFLASSKTVLFQLRSSSPSGSLWIPIQCVFLINSFPFLRVWPIRRHFVISVRNIIGFVPAAPQSSVLLITLGHLVPVIRRKHRLTNVCNLLVIWLVTVHVSHPCSNTSLTSLTFKSSSVYFCSVTMGTDLQRSHSCPWSAF
jgi:hypothetical protein